MSKTIVEFPAQSTYTLLLKVMSGLAACNHLSYHPVWTPLYSDLQGFAVAGGFRDK